MRTTGTVRPGASHKKIQNLDLGFAWPPIGQRVGNKSVDDWVTLEAGRGIGAEGN